MSKFNTVFASHPDCREIYEVQGQPFLTQETADAHSRYLGGAKIERHQRPESTEDQAKRKRFVDHLQTQATKLGLRLTAAEGEDERNQLKARIQALKVKIGLVTSGELAPEED
jgi:hypothetical protein